jgi:hypothetical protein
MMGKIAVYKVDGEGKTNSEILKFMNYQLNGFSFFPSENLYIESEGIYLDTKPFRNYSNDKGEIFAELKILPDIKCITDNENQDPVYYILNKVKTYKKEIKNPSSVVSFKSSHSFKVKSKETIVREYTEKLKNIYKFLLEPLPKTFTKKYENISPFDFTFLFIKEDSQI